MANSYIINLISQNWGQTATVVFIIVCVLIEREDRIKLHPISSFFGWLGKMLTKDIMDDLRRVEKENDMRRIKDLRAEILSMARSLKRFISDGIENDWTSEDYDHAEEVWIEYHELLRKYEMKNGKAIRAMSIISDCSEKHGFGTINLNL